jgi:uncharacterized protein YidB (DUF937 family)
MGLLDVLSGLQKGRSGGGMSPMMMALLGLLAYKALQGRSGGPATSGGSVDEAAPPPQQQGGGLGDLLGGLLGGMAPRAPGSEGELRDLLGGSQAGSVVSNGLRNLVEGFQDSGHAETARSWVGTGPNQEIAPDDLAQALGSDALGKLSQQTGMAGPKLLEELSQQLPEFVNQLTPEGRLPSEEEAARMV